MFDEPNEEPVERPSDPAQRAQEKSDEIRMHAELAAVFEGTKKFDAILLPGLDAQLARDVQRGIGRLEKAKSDDSPVVPPTSADDAAMVLNFAEAHSLSTNDYHIHRRPGEVMIVRWLAGDEVESFYERIQAHFDAGLGGFRSEERQSQEWKRDPETLGYLAALDAIDLRMADRYLRDLIRDHNVFVLSTLAADEMNVVYISEHIMGVSADELVGAVSAPPETPSESDLAWYFKLFALRGTDAGIEKMCFFVYLQKSDDTFDFE